MRNIYQSSCRNCYHFHGGIKCQSAVHMTCACGESDCPSTKLPNEWCSCIYFMPLDNLEYLEYKYERSIK